MPLIICNIPKVAPNSAPKPTDLALPNIPREPIPQGLLDEAHNRNFFQYALEGEINALNALTRAEQDGDVVKGKEALHQWKTARTFLKAMLRKGTHSEDSAGFPYINRAIAAGCQPVIDGLRMFGFRMATPSALALYQNVIPDAIDRNSHKYLIHVMKVPGINVNAPLDNGIPVIEHAWRRGNMRQVKALVNVPGIQLDYPDEQGETLLHKAAGAGDTEFCVTLIDKGADPNKADEFGNTPLHHAAFTGQLDAIQVLVEKGANPNQADQDGRSPLNQSARMGSPEVIQALLDNGADPNITDKDGRTPLHTAVFNKNQPVIETLLNNGADLNKADKHGNRPLLILENRAKKEKVYPSCGAAHAKID